MTTPQKILGGVRLAIGVGAWLAPDTTVKLFGMDPARSDRFVGRLFGAREFALAASVLGAPPAALRTAATIGVAVDAADVLAGFDERRRGTLGTRATVLGPVGALSFIALGAWVAREAA